MESKNCWSKPLDALVEDVRMIFHNVSSHYIKVGFYLYVIRGRELYRPKYHNIYDFGQDVFDLKRSSIASYIAVCERFSVLDSLGRPTDELEERFKGFAFTHLVEMLSLTDGQLAQVIPGMRVKDIRALKSKDGKEEAEDIEGSVTDGSFDSQPAALPMLLWGNRLDKDNFDDFVAAARKVIGHEVAVYYGYDTQSPSIRFFKPDIK